MNDKYAKEIARELRLIRKELEKGNRSQEVTLNVAEALTYDEFAERKG